MCGKGLHNLIKIYEHFNPYHEGIVIRWCKDCGAIVIDGEYDGIVHPGQYMPMRLPKGATNNDARKS